MILPVRALSVRVDKDPARRAAHSIARRLAAAVRARGGATLAVSGGSTTPPMLSVLAAMDLPWNAIDIFQVDERVAPDGDADRNAGQLDGVPGTHHLMPVTAVDLAVAADEYAAGLPERFDVVHLGVGKDGHTASWAPGDPVMGSDRRVDLAGPYQGRLRMTLTPPVVDAAVGRVVLATGKDKAKPIAAWLEGGAPPTKIPVARLRRIDTVVVLDQAAASKLTRATVW
jgi:6-phosphogluconolactonase/glucosamine-6-phosphate isomerase/deaminase